MNRQLREAMAAMRETKRSKVLELLRVGLHDRLIAERAPCARSYVRAVRSREGSPDDDARNRRTMSSRTPQQIYAKLKSLRAYVAARRNDLGVDACRAAARSAYVAGKVEFSNQP